MANQLDLNADVETGPGTIRRQHWHVKRLAESKAGPVAERQPLITCLRLKVADCQSLFIVKRPDLIDKVVNVGQNPIQIASGS